MSQEQEFQSKASKQSHSEETGLEQDIQKIASLPPPPLQLTASKGLAGPIQMASHEHGCNCSRCQGIQLKTAHYQRPVVQRQVQAQPVIQLATHRFDDNRILQRVLAGRATLRLNDTGMHIRILQQALTDAGYAFTTNINGTYDDNTKLDVALLQQNYSLSPSNGETVNRATLQALSRLHESYAPAVEVAQAPTPSRQPREGVEYARGSAPSELTQGTRTLNAAERTEVRSAMDTSPQVRRGGRTRYPNFRERIRRGRYGDRIRARLLAVIREHTRTMVAFRRNEARDPAQLHPMATIEQIAVYSKREVDRVFGSYRTGPPLQAGNARHPGNLRDAFEDERDAINDRSSYGDAMAEDLLLYYLREDDQINQINEQHGAVPSVPSRTQEAGIITRIVDDLKVSKREELLDIHANWPGLANGGVVSLQRVRSSDNEVNRQFMWENFATIIHEYIHTLEHSNHIRYRNRRGNEGIEFTLREGMTDYFTKMVWHSIRFDVNLRRQIEGSYYSAANPPIPEPTYYDQSTNAERAVGVMGTQNAIAAFFLGEVQYIGG